MPSSTEPQAKSVFRITDMISDLKAMRKATSSRKGLSTGWPELDELMTIDTGYLTIATGYPSSGKSEFLDALLVNMAWLHGWKTLYFSPENYPLAEHGRKIIEKFAGDGLRALSASTLNEATQWVDTHFSWMYPPDDKIKLQDILDIAEQEHAANPFQVLVIDPWNEVDHSPQAGKRDDQYIAAALTTLRRFIRKTNIHCFIVAHPVKPAEKKADGTYPVPAPYDISGGATWRNKADYAWAAHRKPNENHCEIHIQKIKLKAMGRLGKAEFDYDWKSGRFKAGEDKDYSLPSLIGSPSPKDEDLPL